MDIEVGEYIRTKDGIIDKVIIKYKGKCNNPNCNGKHISCVNNYYNEGDIKKHSKNIIDLIEVGDFINKKLCIDIEKYPQENGTINFNFVCLGGSVASLVEGVYSIVTKEQYKSIEYKVEE